MALDQTEQVQAQSEQSTDQTRTTQKQTQHESRIMQPTTAPHHPSLAVHFWRSPFYAALGFQTGALRCSANRALPGRPLLCPVA
jgi:hypothetical protein